MKTIKLTIGILMVLFTIKVTNVKAADLTPFNNITGPTVNCTVYCGLAPITPEEADFKDNVPETVVNNYDYLKPVPPKEATFDDLNTGGLKSTLDILLEKLSPVSPKEADFEDVYESENIQQFQPVTPQEAGFDEKF